MSEQNATVETPTATTKPAKKAATKKPATKKAPAKKSAVKKAPANKAPLAKKVAAQKDGKRGRTSKYAGMKLQKTVDSNPRREGTHGHKSFALIKNGMTFEKFVELGGRLVDLDCDVKKGNIKLVK